ncbi:MAG: hypothetical protein LBS68_01025 [Puniceicoccales bacterium]|jgi:hypothetical protein|nr:hypothetical protein [Puniceicoccales bacterium]
MSRKIAAYVVSPIINAYKTLKEEFQKAEEFREEGNPPAESSGPKLSVKAYLVLAGTVVTLLAPLKIIACSVSLLLNYAYSPVTIVLTGLMLLLRKIGWVEKKSPLDFCIFVVALLPLRVSSIMANCTVAEDDTIFFDKLHFLQVKLADLLQ